MKNAFTLAYIAAALVAFLLLSCSTSNSTDPNDPSKKREDLPPYDNNVVIIEPEVKKWMEEQLAAGGNEKRLVVISEMHWEPTDWDYLGGPQSGSMTSGQYDSNSGEVYYILNGERMSKEEYEVRMEEFWKKYQEQQKGKRDLPIPGVISDDAMSWTALMTAQEIYELTENYKELAIGDYREPVPENFEEFNKVD